MLNILYEEVLRNGKRADNGLRSEALKAAADSLNSTLHMRVTKEHVRTRLKTLRKDYKSAKELLEVSGFGFTFDTENKTVVAADEYVWEHYFQAHPDSRHLRGKHFPYYEQLSLIIGNDCANGEGACAGDEEDDEERVEVEGSPTVEIAGDAMGHESFHDFVDCDAGSFETTATNNESSSTYNDVAPRVHSIPPPVQPLMTKRRKSRLGPQDASNSDYAKGIMEAVQTLAVAFGGPDIEDLCDALKPVAKGDKILYLKGLDYLGVDNKQAKIFLGMDTEFRAEWLVDKLNYVKAYDPNEFADM